MRRVMMAFLLALVTGSITSSAIFAQNDPAPTSDKITGAMDAVVATVDGSADYLPPDGNYDDDNAWKPITVDQKIEQGSMISTGKNSSVGIVLYEDNKNNELRSVVVVEQFAEIKFDQLFITENKRAVTDVRLNAGSIRVKIDKVEVQTDMRIATPNATASVTGTKINQIRTGPSGDVYSMGNNGSIRVSNSRGGTRVVGVREVTNEALIRTIEAAKMERITNVLPSGVTGAEIEVLLTQTGTTSIIPGNEESSIFNAAFGRIQALEGFTESGRVIDRTQIPPSIDKSKEKRPQIVE